jgi:hypothetical protein
MDWKQLLAYIAGSVDQQLLLRNEYLVTENRILYQQIMDRLRLSDGERTTLAEIGKKLGRQALAEVATTESWLMPTVKAILRSCCGCFKKAGNMTCRKSCALHPYHCRTWECNRMPQIVTCGRHVSVSKSSFSP